MLWLNFLLNILFSSKFDNPEVIVVFFVNLLFICSTIPAFVHCRSNIHNINIVKYRQDHAENLKYRKMLKSVQDALLLFKNNKLYYGNNHATKLIRHLFQDKMEGGVISKDRVSHEKIFYLYQSSSLLKNNTQEALSDTNLMPSQQSGLAQKYSFYDLLKMDNRVVKNSVFTTREEIHQCKNVDQLQKTVKMIQKNEDKKNFGLF